MHIIYSQSQMNGCFQTSTIAVAVIIIKQLLTKQFSMSIKSSGKRSAV